MAAPAKNQFWKQRSKHGRDIIFSTPELLWEAACEYFEATDSRKWIKKDWVGKDAIKVDRETETPYTLTGLYLFMGCDKETLSEYGKRQDFSDIVTRIRDIIYTQKFEGAAVGVFNSSIISRDLGLKEASTVTINKVGKDLEETYE